MTRWYTDEMGKPSTMRVLAMMSGCTGCLLMLASVVAMFAGIDAAVPMAGIGAGAAGLGEVAKAWQSGRE